MSLDWRSLLRRIPWTTTARAQVFPRRDKLRRLDRRGRWEHLAMVTS
jgi:hypothetical protein